MEGKIANVVFALLSVLMLAGSSFAESSSAVAISLNKAPVITGVGGPTSLSVNQAGTWSVSAYDPDGNYLSYYVNWGEGGSAVPASSDNPGSTATFQHTYSAAGAYTITFTVTDSLGKSTQSSVTVSVGGASANHPPAFTSVTCPVADKSATCYIYASDPDFDPVTYTVNFGDSTPAVAGMQNTFVHTYQLAGTYTITVKAADNHGAEVGTSLQVTVTGTENQKPVITSVAGPSSLPVNQQGTWSISAYDPDGTYLAYFVNWGDSQSASSSGKALGIMPSPTATFQHTYSNAGTYQITFTVKDDKGASAVSTLTVQVAGISASLPDYAVNALASTGINGIYNGQQALYITPNAQMPISAIVKNSGASAQSATTAVFTYFGKSSTATVPALAAGQSATVSAYMYCIGSDSTSTLSVNVNPSHTVQESDYSNNKMVATPVVVCNQSSGGNQPPVITSTSAPYSLEVGQAGTWTVSAYDPDGTYLSYSVNWGEGGSIQTGSPSSAQTGSTATFQHTYSAAGTYTVTFTVTDSAGASTQSALTMVVFDKGSGCPGYVSIDVGKQLSDYNYSAYDIRLDSVSATAATTSVMYNGVQIAQFSIPAYSSKAYSSPYGEALTVSVCYIDSAQKYAFMKLDFGPATSSNLPPVITGVAGPASLSVGQAGTWKVSAYDPDGNYLNWGVAWGDGTDQKNSGQTNSGSAAAFSHTYYTAGAYTAKFTVSDALGASVVSTLSVVVGGPQAGQVTAKVSASPSEVNQYDSVYVAGHVTRGSTAASDTPATYTVVLAFDNGNSIAKEFSAASGSAQVKVEEITLAPGESKEVSAYFTATQLGTNFAKIAVYQKDGGSYKLVASDSAKVLVKDGGIPSPPGDITLKLEKGWNQVSMPTNYTITMQDIASKCDVSTTAWYYDAASKQYVQAASLGYGSAGVWIKANSACTYTLSAPYYAPAAFDLKAGWNMIGSPLQATAIGNFAGDCKITSGPWNYSPAAGQYVYSDKLEPGKGYWVKVASDCRLGSASDMPPPAPSDTTASVQASATVKPVKATAAVSVNGQAHSED